MNPEAWYREPEICGSCIAWRPRDPQEGEEVATGECRLRPELNRVPATLKLCDLYKPRGQFVYQPSKAPTTRRKRTAAARVLRRTDSGSFVPAASPPPAPRGPRPPPPERPPPPRTIDLGEDESLPVFRRALIELVRNEHGAFRHELAQKYKGGSVEMIDGDGNGADLTAERFFSMVDRLKSSLEELEKVVKAGADQELVAIVKRVNGTLTTFNVLFADKSDHFSSR